MGAYPIQARAHIGGRCDGNRCDGENTARVEVIASDGKVSALCEDCAAARLEVSVDEIEQLERGETLASIYAALDAQEMGARAETLGAVSL